MTSRAQQGVAADRRGRRGSRRTLNVGQKENRMKKIEDIASVASLKGLGPKSSAALRTIGINSIEELRARDPFDVYAELKAKVPGTSLNFLYGLIGAIEDVQWQEIKKTRRTAILLRLEDMGIAPQ
jgi:DNA transformation protein